MAKLDYERPKFSWQRVRNNEDHFLNPLWFMKYRNSAKGALTHRTRSQQRRAWYAVNQHEAWITIDRNIRIRGKATSVYAHVRELFVRLDDPNAVQKRGIFESEAIFYFSDGTVFRSDADFYRMKRIEDNTFLLVNRTGKRRAGPVILSIQRRTLWYVSQLIKRGNVDDRDPDHDRTYRQYLEARGKKAKKKD